MVTPGGRAGGGMTGVGVTGGSLDVSPEKVDVTSLKSTDAALSLGSVAASELSLGAVEPGSVFCEAVEFATGDVGAPLVLLVSEALVVVVPVAGPSVELAPRASEL